MRRQTFSRDTGKSPSSVTFTIFSSHLLLVCLGTCLHGLLPAFLPCGFIFLPPSVELGLWVFQIVLQYLTTQQFPADFVSPVFFIALREPFVLYRHLRAFPGLFEFHSDFSRIVIGPVWNLLTSFRIIIVHLP